MKKITSLLLCSFFIFNFTSAQSEKDVALETIGASSAFLLYNTYLAIGAMSDAYIGECYKADFTSQLAQEQINSSEMLIKQYNTLLGSAFVTSNDDKAFISEMVITLGYLKNQATYLKAYTESDSAEDTRKYEYNRNEAWKRISKLLGLKEDK